MPKSKYDTISKDKDCNIYKMIVSSGAELGIYNCNVRDLHKAIPSTAAPLQRPTIDFGNQNIKLSNANSFIYSLKTDKENILSYPKAVFFLEEDEIECKNLSDSYGVICLNSNVSDIDILQEEGFSLEFPLKGIKNSWENFPLGTIFPSNSLIIQDRYFFSKEDGEECLDSMYNFEQILTNFLPMSLSCDYHVLVIFAHNSMLNTKEKIITFEEDKKKIEWTFDEVRKRLKKICNKISKKRNYPIKLELWSIPKGSNGYKDTHNRYIISNYFLLNPLHKLKAFNKSGKVLAGSEHIWCNTLFSEGLGSKRKMTPQTTHREKIKTYRKILKDSSDGTISDLYKYAINDDICGKFEKSKVLNRLLKQEVMPKRYFFEPWKGKDYTTGLNKDGKLVLIVGVSHYCTEHRPNKPENQKCDNYCRCTNCACTDFAGNSSEFNKECKFSKNKNGNDVDLSKTTISEVEKFIYSSTEDNYVSFINFGKFAKEYFKIDSDKDLWNHVAFVNYIQDFEPESKGNHFSNDSNNKYYNAFLDYLADLTPDVIIFWGSALGNHLRSKKIKPKSAQKNDYCWNLYYSKGCISTQEEYFNEDYKEIKCINCYHPCYDYFEDVQDNGEKRLTDAFDWAFEDKSEQK